MIQVETERQVLTQIYQVKVSNSWMELLTQDYAQIA